MILSDFFRGEITLFGKGSGGPYSRHEEPDLFWFNSIMWFGFFSFAAFAGIRDIIKSIKDIKGSKQANDN